ncbi:MAG: hypothetical protein ACOZNI_29350 [Myxococcota bacterium]
MRALHVAALALAAANLALAGAGWARARPVTYVFTPLVDVVPGALDGAEAAALQAGAKHHVDARDMRDAYARLGSTLNLADLLAGVESLEDLSQAQRARLAAILDGARADHAAVVEVQREILDLERRLDAQAAELRVATAGQGGHP